jgi:hypothetical protein
MAQIPQPYEYQQLKNESEFRLLKVEEVLPRTEPRKWKYSVIHTHLSIAPPFETVSWVWGSGSRDRPLTVDDEKVVYISQNLDNAISTLSLFCCTGYLWIDQTCIDQNTTLEKNHQVKIMGRIYQRASRVLVWLRKPLHLQSVDFDHLCILANETQSGSEEKLLKLKAYFYQNSSLIQLFQEYFSSTWFRRAWVYQEIILPQKSAFIMGHVELPMPALHLIAQAIKAETKDVVWTDLPPIEYVIQKHSKRNIEILNTMHTDWEAWHAQELSLNNTREPFENFLSLVVPDAKVSNECDSIYAFLGLNRISSRPGVPYIPIEPNYQYSQRQTFISVTKAIINVTRKLNIFEFLCRKMEHQKIPALFTRVPTWAPDFTLREVGMRFSSPSDKSLPLVKHVDPHKTPRDDLFEGLELAVWGAPKDKIYKHIDQLSSYETLSASFNFPNYVETARAYWNDNFPLEKNIIVGRNGQEFTEAPNEQDVLLALLLGGHCDFVSSRYPQHSLMQTIQKTSPVLMKHSLFNDEKGTPLEYDQRKTLKDRLIHAGDSISADDKRLLWDILSVIQLVCNDRNLYITMNGRLVVGRDLRPGDELCILEGCHRPVALRESLTNPGYYGVVETCYLQGYMDPWSEEDVTEKGKGGRVYVLF